VTQIIDFYSLILAHTVKVRSHRFFKILFHGNDLKTLNTPDQKFLSGTETSGHITVGDEEFRHWAVSMYHHVLRPYRRKNLTKKNRIFNYCCLS